jgi:hypothetical protein
MFTLQVEFSGLCLYLIHPDGKRIGIAMPDGRFRSDRPLLHLDGTPAKSHVGYLRFDLADTGVAVPHGGRKEHPVHEVVHLFDMEELDFGLDSIEKMTKQEIVTPDVVGFAPLVQPLLDLFTPNPPPELLMRTVINGGALDSVPDRELWQFDDLFNPGTKYRGRFAGFSTWTRQVDADELVLRINQWDGTEKVAIRLRPMGPQRTIKLKIANLCAENPMEWPELGLRAFNSNVDEDFKWFYRLLRHPEKPFSELTTQERGLPVPTLTPESEISDGGPPNCESCKQTIDFDSLVSR